jgi:hypothetical protein
MLQRNPTAAAAQGAAPGLFQQLDAALKGGEGEALVAKTRVRHERRPSRRGSWCCCADVA